MTFAVKSCKRATRMVLASRHPWNPLLSAASRSSAQAALRRMVPSPSQITGLAGIPHAALERFSPTPPCELP